MNAYTFPGLLRKNFPPPDRERRVAEIKRIVGEYYDITAGDMEARTRKQEVVLARYAALFLCRKFTQCSLKRLGEIFGARDHTTVIHACNTMQNRIDTDEVVMKQVQELQYLLQIKFNTQ